MAGRDDAAPVRGQKSSRRGLAPRQDDAAPVQGQKSSRRGLEPRQGDTAPKGPSGGAIPFLDRYGPNANFGPVGAVNKQLEYGTYLSWPVLCSTADDPVGCLNQFIPETAVGAPKQ